MITQDQLADFLLRDLREQYQQDIEWAEKEYLRRRTDIEQGYQLSIEQAIRDFEVVKGPKELVMEYVSVLTHSPFWIPLVKNDNTRNSF